MQNEFHDGCELQLNLEDHPNGTILPVRARAGARQNAILGMREGVLRVSVTAAPEKGKANRAIVTLLGKTLGVPKSAIELLSGDTSPLKHFLVHEVDSTRIHQTLSRFIANQKQ